MVLIGSQIKTPAAARGSDDEETVTHIDFYLNTTFGTQYKLIVSLGQRSTACPTK